MKRKITVITLCAMLLALTSSAEAQQPKTVPRIGYLAGGNAATESTRSEGIRLALRELGYIEGQNIDIEYRYIDIEYRYIDIEYRYTEGKVDRHPELVAELVRLK